MTFKFPALFDRKAKNERGFINILLCYCVSYDREITSLLAFLRSVPQQCRQKQ